MAMLFFVVSMTALTSCNKQAHLIVGIWQCTTATYTDEGTTYPIPDVVRSIWEFKANGNLIIIAGEGEDNTGTVAYVISGNLLTIDAFCGTQTYVIQELTKSKLVLEPIVNWAETAVIEFKKI